jgi:hypothetical protein
MNNFITMVRRSGGDGNNRLMGSPQETGSLPREFRKFWNEKQRGKGAADEHGRSL